jgi:hypothetical protein
MVVHVEYPRSCLECTHCHVSGGSPHYSELTPGSGASFECYKNLWDLDTYDVDKEALLSTFDKARNCKSFERTQWAAERYGDRQPCTHKMKF